MIKQFSGRESWEIEERESATEMGKGKKVVGRDRREGERNKEGEMEWIGRDAEMKRGRD